MDNKTKALMSVLVVFGLVVLCGNLVSAYDASTPYTVTMKWIVTVDTTFAVDLCGSETTIDFNDNLGASTTKTLVEPDCQNISTTTPMAVITNNGNVNMDFSNNLTASKPAWAVLSVASTATCYGDAFDTTAVVIDEDVIPAGEVNVYYCTNVSSADTGTTQRTLQINGVASA